jgi:hypothetical protein
MKSVLLMGKWLPLKLPKASSKYYLILIDVEIDLPAFMAAILQIGSTTDSK